MSYNDSDSEDNDIDILINNEIHNMVNSYATKCMPISYVVNTYIDIDNFKCTYYFGEKNKSFDFCVIVSRCEKRNTYDIITAEEYQTYINCVHPKRLISTYLQNVDLFNNVDYDIIKKTLMKTYICLNLDLDDDNVFINKFYKRSDAIIKNRQLNITFKRKTEYSPLVYINKQIEFKTVKIKKIYFTIKNVFGVENSIYLGII